VISVDRWKTCLSSIEKFVFVHCLVLFEAVSVVFLGPVRVSMPIEATGQIWVILRLLSRRSLCEVSVLHPGFSGRRRPRAAPYRDPLCAQFSSASSLGQLSVPHFLLSPRRFSLWSSRSCTAASFPLARLCFGLFFYL
jgi:hypothetical protein